MRRLADRAEVKQQNVQAPPRLISKAMQTEIDKLKQSPHINKRQFRRILQITKGDISGLKVGYRPETNNVWIVYRGKRYDINKIGKLSIVDKLGRQNPVGTKAKAKKLKCPLCGELNNVPDNELHIKCQSCGFPLRRVRVKIK